MRRLVVGTAVMAACSAGYALAGDLDGHRLRLALVMVAWWAARRARGPVGPGRAPPLARRRPCDGSWSWCSSRRSWHSCPACSVHRGSSSDAYRYVWDGRVQLAGTSPYRYAPLDDRLAPLRDPLLFPGLGPRDRSGYVTQPVPTDRGELLSRSSNDPRTRINRPQVPTIYPPVAQAWFTAWRG